MIINYFRYALLKSKDLKKNDVNVEKIKKKFMSLTGFEPRTLRLVVRCVYQSAMKSSIILSSRDVREGSNRLSTNFTQHKFFLARNFLISKKL